MRDEGDIGELVETLQRFLAPVKPEGMSVLVGLDNPIEAIAPQLLLVLSVEVNNEQLSLVRVHSVQVINFKAIIPLFFTLRLQFFLCKDLGV
jgi:hypothetical protein